MTQECLHTTQNLEEATRHHMTLSMIMLVKNAQV